MNEWIDEWMDEWMDGWMGGWMDGWMDGWDGSSEIRRLKIKSFFISASFCNASIPVSSSSRALTFQIISVKRSTFFKCSPSIPVRGTT